jgi:hypothetical protein
MARLKLFLGLLVMGRLALVLNPKNAKAYNQEEG